MLLHIYILKITIIKEHYGFINLLLLLSEIGLDLLEIQQLWAEFESQWQFLLQNLSILLNLLGMSVFELTKGLSVFFLSLEQVFIPLLIEFLVLLDVGLFTFFSLLSLIENELLVSFVVILSAEFDNSVFGHFGFNVFALNLTSVSMIFENLTIKG